MPRINPQTGFTMTYICDMDRFGDHVHVEGFEPIDDALVAEIAAFLTAWRQRFGARGLYELRISAGA